MTSTYREIDELAERQASSLLSFLRSIESPLRRQGLALESPDELATIAGEAYRAMLSTDVAGYLDARLRAGDTLRRSDLEIMTSRFQEEGLLPKFALDGLSDRELLVRIWATGPDRGMIVAEADLPLTRCGTGTVQLIGGDDWPYDGMWAATSFFDPGGVKLSGMVQKELENTSKSAYVLLHVTYADGCDGLLRINFLYLDGLGWRAISAAVASENPTRWPAPLL